MKERPSFERWTVQQWAARNLWGWRPHGAGRAGMSCGDRSVSVFGYWLAMASRELRRVGEVIRPLGWGLLRIMELRKSATPPAPNPVAAGACM